MTETATKTGDGGTVLAPKKLAVGLVVDRSGSMSANWKKTVDALNEYLNSLKDDKLDAVVTVVAFDSGSIDTVRDAVPAAKCSPITADEFPPRGLTPLLDAVGRTIDRLSIRTARPDEGVALVVMTDGMENASSDYTRERLKALLAQKQDKENWLVVFLGEGIDAWAQGHGTGVYMGNTAQYSGANVASALRGASAATVSYACTGSNDVSATLDGFRAAMVGEEGKKDDKKDASDPRFTTFRAKDKDKVKAEPLKKW